MPFSQTKIPAPDFLNYAKDLSDHANNYFSRN